MNNDTNFDAAACLVASNVWEYYGQRGLSSLFLQLQLGHYESKSSVEDYIAGVCKLATDVILLYCHHISVLSTHSSRDMVNIDMLLNYWHSRQRKPKFLLIRIIIGYDVQVKFFFKSVCIERNLIKRTWCFSNCWSFVRRILLVPLFIVPIFF